MIYYGFGNILNDTYEVCSWDPWFDLSMEIDGPDGTIANCVQARIDILLSKTKKKCLLFLRFQERDGDAWIPGCVTESGLNYCNYDGIRRTVALKEKNPNLKVFFSVGGWTAGGWIFSQVCDDCL